MPYIAGRKSTFDYVHILEEHAHSISKCYPTLAGGVSITSGVVWTLGAFTELIPINTITEVFDIHWLIVESVTDDETYELVFYNVETEISRVRWSSDLAAGGRILSVPIPTLMGLQEANSQIQCKLASSGATETVVISVLYHTY